jgi:CobQ-like glutamine amidotransferase family enzyme
MKIVVAHLYYDLLNLYGESGNVDVLVHSLKQLDIGVELKKLSLEDEFDFATYDFIYIGCGTNYNQNLAIKHLLKYKNDIKKIVNKKHFLLTGNALEMFGKYIIDEKEQINCLDIFDYYSYRDDRRYVDEVIEENSLFKNKIIGFRNQGSFTNNVKSPLFEMIKGKGNNLDSNEEGFINDNFMGTYLLGPILARNPEFLGYILNRLLNDLSIKPKKSLNLSLDKKAYDHYLDWKYKKTKF